MDWATFVSIVLANPLLLLSWEFVTSCFASWLVLRFTGHRITFPAIRAGLAKAIAGDPKKSFREKLAERIAGKPDTVVVVEEHVTTPKIA